MNEILFESVDQYPFNMDKTYFLVTEDDIYKLQTVNNVYAQDPTMIEYAFCPFSRSYTYFGGHIGNPNKVIQNVLKMKQGRIFESNSKRSVENLYLLLAELLKNIQDLDILDDIKYKESRKKSYDVGYIKALMLYIKK